MNDPDDLTEGWPDEPDHAELARFAADLQASLPALPDAALHRIEARITAEPHAAPRRQPWRLLTAAGVAAAVLAALGWWGRAVWVQPDAPTVAVEDRFPVAFVPAAMSSADDRPLVRLADYQSLFESGQ